MGCLAIQNSGADFPPITCTLNSYVAEMCRTCQACICPGPHASRPRKQRRRYKHVSLLLLPRVFRGSSEFDRNVHPCNLLRGVHSEHLNPTADHNMYMDIVLPPAFALFQYVPYCNEREYNKGHQITHMATATLCHHRIDSSKSSPQ